MSIPTSEPIPDESENLSPARRRRDRRSVSLLGVDERSEVIDDLIHRTTPSVDFFLFSLVCGIVLGLGILLDSPALLFLAPLAAPFLAPVFGLSLSIIVGTGRYFLRTLVSALLGSLLVFLGSALVGLALKMEPRLPFHQFTLAPLHARLTWLDFAVLTLGIILTSVLMVRSENKPLIPSALMAYGLTMPVGVAGFGLASGIAHLWPNGLAVFFAYLLWTIILGAITLVILGFRPITFLGYALAATMALIGIMIVVGLSNAVPLLSSPVTLPRLAPTQTNTPTLTETVTQTLTPVPPTLTFTPTHTLVPSPTITPTLVPSPTPVWALINSTSGAVVREEPKSSAKIVAYLLNGSLVKVYTDTAKEGTTVWVRISTEKGVEGWIVQILLVTATPAPSW